MAGAQLGGSPRDLASGGFNRRRKGLEEGVHGITARCAMPERRDEDLGVGRRGDDEPVAAIVGGRKRAAGAAVMHIVSVQLIVARCPAPSCRRASLSVPISNDCRDAHTHAG